MSHFAVIQVDQCYDDIEEVECLIVLPTEKEADDYVESFRHKANVDWENRMKYIEKWIDNIVLPDLLDKGYHEWVEYLKQYTHLGGRYVLPQDFKKELKSYLRHYYGAKLEGYNPPEAKEIFVCHNLFVVEFTVKTKQENHV